MNHLSFTLFIVLSILLSTTAFSQEFYINSKGDKHLIGSIEVHHLEEPEFQDWYRQTFDHYQPEISIDLSGVFKEVKVKAFIGTWCGDTKSLLPKFIKYWEEAGLRTDQIELIALHNEGSEYKRSPQRIEGEYDIHRVPTFIFEKGEVEIGRIVERPLNSLDIDITQIALGFPSQPRYQAARTVYNFLELKSAESLLVNMKELIRATYRVVSTASELNTLGYVFKAKDEEQAAELVFKLNAKLFKYDPNVYDSLGELYFDTGRFEESKACFEEVLSLDQDNVRAKDMITLIDNRERE